MDRKQFANKVIKNVLVAVAAFVYYVLVLPFFFIRALFVKENKWEAD